MCLSFILWKRLASRRSHVRITLALALQVIDHIADTSVRVGDSKAERVIKDFVQSLKQGKSSGGQQVVDNFTTLPDLLSSSTTIPLLQTFPESLVDSLLAALPAPVLLLAHSTEDDAFTLDDEVSWNATLDSDEKFGLIMSLSLQQKKQVLAKVLRSPQLSQSLGSLTVALRDGGLPTVASALGIKVKNEGYIRGSAMPLGGGEAVRAFVEGVKDNAEKESVEGVEHDDQMDVE
jgi:26S proteasome regulatory subunit N13